MTSDISALMDGELDPDATARVLANLRQDERLRATWETYQLIGDALRGSGPLALDITGKVARRLAQEPTVLAPRPHRTQPAPRRPALALAASVAALGLVGLLAWQQSRLYGAKASTVQVAAVETRAPLPVLQPATRPGQTAKADGQEPPRVRFPVGTGEAYLLAHQEFSPSYAMAGMPAYVRVVAQPEAGQ
ncbi:sigma-E factor negative regulatory protein [Thiobacter aerophilum]|uniref:Sigma-E factor negative regulatory protein n=1 Tax=Thiobacter aerophilum TaxID=3121275 RepID=A0ABV0EAZ2_9BURK